jgi:hypothetical protein
MQKVERMNENLKQLQMVRCHGLLHIISIPNGHTPLCGEQIVFGLTHTSWCVNMFMCH